MLFISLAALFMAVLKLPRLGQLRRIAIVFALGAGQIHLAALAQVLFLFSENGYRLPRFASLHAILFAGISLIVFVTLISPVSERMISELLQLFVYAVTLMLFAAYLRDPDRFYPLLSAMAIGASLVAIVAIFSNLSGITSPPHIYLGRGSNEGSFFLLAAGMIPAITLFLAKKRLIYIPLAAIIFVAMIMATSRASIILGILVILGGAFFLTGSRWLRFMILSLIVCAAYGSLELFPSFFQQEINYSALQRIALYDFGWSLWQARPLTGWGWGASSALVPKMEYTGQGYPHFHSTYIQFIVELGALGWFFISVWITGAFWMIFSGLLSRIDRAGAFYMVMSNIALLGSGISESLLFGADRALQVVVVFALNGALLQYWRLGKEQAKVRTAMRGQM